MSKEPIPLNFPNEATRGRWIISNADYFTAVRFRKQRYERHECPTLAAAVVKAKQMIAEAGGPIMIYAVAGDSSTWVQNVS